MGRRSEHSKDELRAMIITATAQLVRQIGADRVTARQIAEEVGYTPGMLYSVFQNLQDIYMHVNLQSVELLYKACAQAAEPHDDPQIRVRAMCHGYHVFALTETHIFDLLYQRQLVKGLEPPPGLQSQASAIFMLVETELERIAPTRCELERRKTARALWSGVHGTTELALGNLLYLDGQEASRDILDALITRVLSGWASRDAGAATCTVQA